MRLARTLLALVAIAAPTRAGATIVLELDLPALVGRADAIFVGKVTEVKSRWTTDQRHIVTDTTLDVEQGIKGPAARSVVVRHLGGVVGEIGMLVSGMPRFKTGEQVLLFTESQQGRRFVVGLGQGVYAVGRDERGRPTVRARTEGMTLAQRTPRGLEPVAPRGPRAELLDDFVARIRQTIALCAKEKSRCTAR